MVPQGDGTGNGVLVSLASPFKTSVSIFKRFRISKTKRRNLLFFDLLISIVLWLLYVSCFRVLVWHIAFYFPCVCKGVVPALLAYRCQLIWDVCCKHWCILPPFFPAIDVSLFTFLYSIDISIYPILPIKKNDVDLMEIAEQFMRRRISDDGTKNKAYGMRVVVHIIRVIADWFWTVQFFV